jgi:hypoxanthine phosphoribosyltransferase
MVELREDQESSLPLPRHYTWGQFDLAVVDLAKFIMTRPHWERRWIWGVPRGGLPLAVALSHKTGIPLILEMREGAVIADDIYDSGQTIQGLWGKFPGSSVVCWLHRLDLATAFAQLPSNYKSHALIGPKIWAIFPWEDPDKAMDDYRAYRNKLQQGEG